MGKREEIAADKEAAIIQQSLKRAGEAAVETALKSVTDTLKANVPLLYHINMLLHNDEWRGVLMSSIAGYDGDKPDADVSATPVGRKLRTGLKKFAHLDRPAGVGDVTPPDFCDCACVCVSVCVCVRVCARVGDCV